MVAYRRRCTTGLAALRSPCSRLQVLGLPSVASPFAGGERSLDARLFPAHPPPYDGLLIFVCPKQGTERKGTSGFRAGRHLCRECRDAQERPAPRMYTSHAGCPRSALVSDGPGKGHPWSWPGRATCCASLSVLLLASPGLAVRGEPVQRGKGPPDLCLDPLHPYRAPAGVFFAFVPHSA